MRLSFLAVFVVLAVAGCRSSERTAAMPYALSQGVLDDHLSRLSVAAADSAEAARQVRYAASRMRAGGLMPVFASSFLLSVGRSAHGGPDPARAHVLGYVPGRHPSRSDTLVLVAAPIHDAGAAAVLESARRLALEALDAQVPARTVLFALWAPGPAGDRGLADYLARPTWGLDRVVHAVLVTADTAAAARDEALLAEQGIASEVLTAPRRFADGAPRPREVLRAETHAFAEILHLRVRARGLGENGPASLSSPRSSTPDAPRLAH